MYNAGAANGDGGEGFQPVLLLHRRLPAPGDPLVQGRLGRGGGGERLQGWQDEDRTKQRAPHCSTKKGGQLAIIEELRLIFLVKRIKFWSSALNLELDSI